MRSTSVVADACAKRAKFVSQYVIRMEGRCQAEADKNLVFGGAYVQYLAFFESQLETLFVGLLTGSLAHPDAGVRPIVMFNNARVAKGIIFGGRNYVDWLPYEQHTIKRSPVFLKDGRPFSDLDNPRRQTLTRASILRNAIAHQSDHSLNQFEKHFLSGRAVPSQQRRPSTYLRGNYSLTMNRFEAQMRELVAVMNALCT